MTASYPASGLHRNSATLLAGGRIAVFESFPVSSALPLLYPLLRGLYLPPSGFYVTLASIREGRAAGELARTLPLPLAMLLAGYLRDLAALDFCALRSGDGFEVFSNVAASTTPVRSFLHVDSDEILRKRDGIVRTPLAGSILHVGPPEGLLGGETALFPARDQGNRETEPLSRYPLFCRYAWEELASIPGAEIITQKAGRLILFEGDIPHAVAPVRNHSDAQPRVTLLANLWDRPVLPD